MIAAGLALAQQTAPAQQTTPAGALPGSQVQASQAVRIGVALGLTMDQRAQVQKIIDEQDNRLQPLEQQLQVNRRSIHALIGRGEPGEEFDKQIESLANTQGSLVSQITLIRAKSISQIWAMLTPEQRQRATRMPGLLSPDGPEEQGMTGAARPRTGWPSGRSRMMRPVQPTQAQ